MEDAIIPENIHLPCIYVQRVVKGEKYDKVIEVSTLYCLISGCTCIILHY